MFDTPQSKWAVYALLGVYVWFMVLVPAMELFTHDPNDKTLSNSRSRWFIQLLIGLVPLILVGYNYYKTPPPPAPPKPDLPMDEFASKIDVFTRALENPKVVYLPYPSTATPVEPPKAAPKVAAKAVEAPEVQVESPAVK